MEKFTSLSFQFLNLEARGFISKMGLIIIFQLPERCGTEIQSNTPQSLPLKSIPDDIPGKFSRFHVGTK